MKTIQLNNAVWKEGDYFVAQCLNVDVSSFGKTREEALADLQEALNFILKNKTFSRCPLPERHYLISSGVYW